MPAHVRPSSHAYQRSQPVVSRPSTVLALGLAVSALTVTALVHTPAHAQATDTSSAASNAPTTGSPSGASALPSSSQAPDQTRLARVVAIRQQRVARKEVLKERRMRRERRELKAAREARQQRRADAQAAARAAARAPQFVMPVPGAGWSASFGEAGSMWSSGYHTGQDFTAPAGTPVHAVADGTITSATWSDAYGNIIEITHPGGDQSWYAHMSSFAQTSGSVSAGDVIGYVGCTGNCFGTHLHLEYHPGGGEAADPVAWLRQNGAL
ncbi:MAG: M23 family metallopeptidase [Actinomycetes bacterium]